MFDTHCHLDLPEFDEDRGEVLTRAMNSGFQYFMIPGIELASMDKVISISEGHENIWFASGIHSNNASELAENWADRVAENTKHPKCRAIGEIGMDYYREYCPHEIQKDVFAKQLDLAADLNLPVIIHCRNAFEEMWTILSPWLKGGHGRSGVLHAFDETAERAMDAIDLGMKIGIGGPYTYKKKNERRFEILRCIPIEAVLLETDCPYLSPIPHRGERNEPAFAALTLAKIAEIKDMPFEEADRITTETACEFFRI